MIKISIPGSDDLDLHHLILDMNGTLTTDGQLPEGVAERLERLKSILDIYLLTADTFGTGAGVAEILGIKLFIVDADHGGADKAKFTNTLDPSSVAAIGNGNNDVDMFKLAKLSIAIMGREGCSVAALVNADIAVNNINDALDLLLNPVWMRATLRR